MGNINFKLGCIISLGAIIGGVLGGRYANSVNEKTLQKIRQHILYYSRYSNGYLRNNIVA
jgi:hypothetical protein